MVYLLFTAFIYNILKYSLDNCLFELTWLVFTSMILFFLVFLALFLFLTLSCYLLEKLLCMLIIMSRSIEENFWPNICSIMENIYCIWKECICCGFLFVFGSMVLIYQTFCVFIVSLKFLFLCLTSLWLVIHWTVDIKIQLLFLKFLFLLSFYPFLPHEFGWSVLCI